MPNIRSAKKRLRQDEKKRVRNQSIKTRMKTTTKKALAGEDVKSAFSAIDKASAKGVIHRNAAARRKSRLAKRLASATAA